MLSQHVNEVKEHVSWFKYEQSIALTSEREERPEIWNQLSTIRSNNRYSLTEA